MNGALSSFATLFANTLQNPSAAGADSDLRLMQAILELVSVVESVRNWQLDEVSHLLNICKEMEDMARQAVEQQQGRQSVMMSAENHFLPYARPTIHTYVDEGLPPWPRNMADQRWFESNFVMPAVVTNRSALQQRTEFFNKLGSGSIASSPDTTSPDSIITQDASQDTLAEFVLTDKDVPPVSGFFNFEGSDLDFNQNLLDFDYGELQCDMDGILQTA